MNQEKSIEIESNHAEPILIEDGNVHEFIVKTSEVPTFIRVMKTPSGEYLFNIIQPMDFAEMLIRKSGSQARIFFEDIADDILYNGMRKCLFKDIFIGEGDIGAGVLMLGDDGESLPQMFYNETMNCETAPDVEAVENEFHDKNTHINYIPIFREDSRRKEH